MQALNEDLRPPLPYHLRQQFGPALPPATPTDAEREELSKLRERLCKWPRNEREGAAQEAARRRLARLRMNIARRCYPLDYMAPEVAHKAAIAYAIACDEFVRECAAGVTRPNLPFSPL